MKTKRTYRVPYESIVSGRNTDTHEYYLYTHLGIIHERCCTKAVYESMKDTLDYLDGINAKATISFYVVRDYIVDYKVHINYFKMLKLFITSIKGK